MQPRLVKNYNEFEELTRHWQGPIACDTETYGVTWEPGGRLLGVSLACKGFDPLYVPAQQYNYDTQTWDNFDCNYLKSWLSEQRLVGHNFTYDKRWLSFSGFRTTWVADTRIMWHLASNPAGAFSYGLKELQVDLLGWSKSNDAALAEEVEARGGSLKNGDHYLASLEKLGYYAALDAQATIEGYHKLSSFFNDYDYWWMLEQMLRYNELLELNTSLGVKVDKPGLEETLQKLLERKETNLERFRKELKEEIGSLELDWAERKIQAYKREHNKKWYREHPEEWEKFNLNSDSQKRELFYGKLKQPINFLTKGKKPSVSMDTLKTFNHPGIEPLLVYENANTLASNFASPYLESLDSRSRLHPGFNICGTVSYRLSGFKPYLLNAPFSETGLMKNLVCDEGYVGVHADLSAIEPTITAHFSEDPYLMKVFGQGLGDIYLDLALELFPRDEELSQGYNPGIPVSKEVKQRFELQRKVAKIIQLAVQYTGTERTVYKNLLKAGVPVTQAQARRYVNAYWRKFRQVDLFNQKLHRVYAKQHYLTNVIGRIIRVPEVGYKDLPNRFIQSSAHDVLILWVLKIYELCREQGIDIKPILLDCHDSTSNQCPVEQVPALKQVYKDALEFVGNELMLCVRLKADVKTFKTLAGLKGEE